jgi:hypothetical protein
MLNGEQVVERTVLGGQSLLSSYQRYICCRFIVDPFILHLISFSTPPDIMSIFYSLQSFREVESWRLYQIVIFGEES